MSTQKKMLKNGKRVLSLILSVLIVWNMCMGNIGPSLVTTIASESEEPSGSGVEGQETEPAAGGEITPTESAPSGDATGGTGETPESEAPTEESGAKLTISEPEDFKGMYPGNTYTLSYSLTATGDQTKSAVIEWSVSPETYTNDGATLSIASGEDGNGVLTIGDLEFGKTLGEKASFTVTAVAKVDDEVIARAEYEGEVLPFEKVDVDSLTFTDTAASEGSGLQKEATAGNTVSVKLGEKTESVKISLGSYTHYRYCVETDENKSGSGSESVSVSEWQSMDTPLSVTARTYVLQFKDDKSTETSESITVYFGEAPSVTATVAAEQKTKGTVNKNGVEETWYAETKDFEITPEANGIPLKVYEGTKQAVIYYADKQGITTEDDLSMLESNQVKNNIVTFDGTLCASDSVYFYVKDIMGNVSAASDACAVGDIDTTAPVITAKAGEEDVEWDENGNATYYTNDASVAYTFAFSDDETGIGLVTVNDKELSESLNTYTTKITQYSEEVIPSLAPEGETSGSTDEEIRTDIGTDEGGTSGDGTDGSGAADSGTSESDGTDGSGAADSGAEEGSDALPEGSYRYNFEAVNGVGMTKNATFTVVYDVTAPTFEFDATQLQEGFYNSENAGKEQSVIVKVSDSGSGLEGTLSYEVKNGDETIYTEGVTITEGTASIPLTHIDGYEGVYTYELTASDQAGNSNEEPCKFEIVWDTKAPTVAASPEPYYNAASATEKPKLSVSITDETSGLKLNDEVTYKVYKKTDGEETELTELTEFAGKAEVVIPDGTAKDDVVKEKTVYIPLATDLEDGNYIYQVTVMDVAGNPYSTTFAIEWDQTLPTCESITVSDGESKSLWGKLWALITEKTKVTITVDAKDKNGIKEVTCSYINKKTNEKTEDVSLEKTKAINTETGESYFVYSCTLSLEAGTEIEVTSIKIEDEKENINQIDNPEKNAENAHGTIVIDEKTPKLAVSFPEDGNEVEVGENEKIVFFSTSALDSEQKMLQVKFELEEDFFLRENISEYGDNKTETKENGEKQVVSYDNHYGNASESFQVWRKSAIDEEYPLNPNAYTPDDYNKWESQQSGRYTKTLYFEPGYIYKVEYEMKDAVNHKLTGANDDTVVSDEGVYTVEFAVPSQDATIDSISIEETPTYTDGNGAAYYNDEEGLTVQVRITDQFFDESSVELTATKDGDPVTLELSNWTKNEGTYTWSGTAVIKDDGKYSNITASYKDRTGREEISKVLTTGGESEEATEEPEEAAVVILDRTVPVVTITYDLNTPSNGGFYNAARTATVTVKERNFDPGSWPLNAEGNWKSNGEVPDFSDWKCKDESKIGISDDCEWTATVIFADDDDYTFTFTCEDLLGQKSKFSEVTGENMDQQSFTIDRTAPEIVVFDYSDALDCQSAKCTKYYNDENPAKLTIRVKEHNFKPDALDVVYDSDVEKVNIKDTLKAAYIGGASIEVDEVKGLQDYLQNPDNWKPVSGDGNEDVYETTYTFCSDAVYTLEQITITDMAGNPVTHENENLSDVFTVDNTEPNEISYKVTKCSFNQGYYSYQYFDADYIEVTATVKNDFSCAYDFTFIAKDIDGNDVESTIRSAQIGEMDENSIYEITTYTIQLSPNFKGTLSGRATDLTGNEQTAGMTKKGSDELVGFVIEDAAKHTSTGSITITPDRKPNDNGFYNKSVDVTVAMEDSYSGIGKLSWEANVGETSKLSVDHDYTSEGEYRNDEYSETRTLDAETFNSNHVNVTASFTDNTGREMTGTPLEMKIDSVAPVVTITYDLNDPSNGGYYNGVRTATITVHERNFDESRSVLNTTDNWTSIHGSAPQFSEWTCTTPDLIGESDDCEWTATVTFAADDDYSFTFTCVDLADNASVFSEETANNGTDKQYFTIDRTEPKLEIAYSTPIANRSTAECTRYYNANTPAKVTFTVTEHNFDPNALDVADPAEYGISAKEIEITDGVKATYISGTDVSVSEVAGLQAYLRDASSWTTVGDVHTATYAFDSNAVYTLEQMKIVDLAGNADEHKNNGVSDVFIVDKTSPNDISYSITKHQFGPDTYLSYQYFDPDYIEVTATVQNDFARAYSFEFTATDIDGSVISGADPVASGTRTFVQNGTREETKYTIILPSDFKGQISGLAEDYSANSLRILCTSGFVAESDSMHNTTGSITIAPDRAPNANGFYNSDVYVTVRMSDTYSGIRTISWNGNVGNESRMPVGYDYTSADDVVYSYNETRALNASTFNSNHVNVTASFTDNAGRSMQQSQPLELKIDNVKPVVSVTYDLNDPANGRYYNKTRTATVQVTERNFDESRVNFTYTSQHGSAPSISGWTCVAGSPGESDDTIWQATVTFASDDDYTFTFTCTDLADNESDPVETQSFTIDQTAPVISVSYQNKDVANGKYYKADQVGVVTVTEHNFEQGTVQTDIKASLDGVSFSAPQLSAFGGSGDVHTARVNYTQDGDYSFTVSYTDAAGNVSTAYVTDYFTVDKTAPEIVISGVENQKAYPNAVMPQITFTDVNYKSDGISWTLTRLADFMDGNSRDQKADYTYTKTNAVSGHGEVISYSDFAYLTSVDGIYELSASITDMAGNVTEVEGSSMVFSVNRFGSTYMLEDEQTKELLDKGFVNAEEEVVYTEINPNKVYHMEKQGDGSDVRVEGSEIWVTYDNNSTPSSDLLESGNYSVKASADNSRTWNAYTYTIYKENFENEGHYEIMFKSTDEGLADDANKEQSRNASDAVLEELLPEQTGDETKQELADGKSRIRFTVDKTAPTVVISGIEENEIYNAEVRDVSIDASDSIALDSVEVFVDGESEMLESEIYTAQGGYVYALQEYKQPRTVKVVVTDRAGNSSEKTLAGVLVSSSGWVRFYNNKPLFVGSIVGVVVVIGGIIFLILFLKRRKDKDEEEQQAQA